ncbi:MAG: DUF1854 domain-containing protein [Clostridia bacterium]|nr:DUF1854 domain-containing protein [Clostridia bacterium]MBR3974497.1 DUF1854 domain-containing protein [Clostridia bacterium]
MINYIDGPEIRVTENDGIFVDVEFFHTKEKFVSLEPHRLFPRSGGNKYIALMTQDGEQIAIIRDVASLHEDSRKVIENALNEYYMIPRITRFIKMTEKFQIWIWTAETDQGIISFEIRNHIASIKPLYDGRVLIKDGNDNRYEIPDYRKLDKKSRKMLLPKL